MFYLPLKIDVISFEGQETQWRFLCCGQYTLLSTRNTGSEKNKVTAPPANKKIHKKI